MPAGYRNRASGAPLTAHLLCLTFHEAALARDFDEDVETPYERCAPPIGYRSTHPIFLNAQGARSPMLNTKPILLAAIVSLPLAACGKKQVESLPPEPGSGPSVQAAQVNGAFGVVPGSQADFQQRMAGREVIFFDTDQFNIDSADAEALQTQAQWLAQFPGTRATIEGHTDERGTREYNLALGERRANAARNHLISLGVSSLRLSVVSYGKERPTEFGSDEVSWARNRRAVTVMID